MSTNVLYYSRVTGSVDAEGDKGQFIGLTGSVDAEGDKGQFIGLTGSVDAEGDKGQWHPIETDILFYIRTKC